MGFACTAKARRKFESRHLRTRRGTAIVEAAIMLPLVVILLLGTWELGRISEVQQILNNGVREGARQAAAGVMTNSQVQSVVTNYVKNAGLPTTNLSVTVQDLTSTGTDV